MRKQKLPERKRKRPVRRTPRRWRGRKPTRRTGLEAELETLRAQVEAEATDRAKAQAEAEAARAEARDEALRVARAQGQAEAAAQQWRQRVNDAENAAAQAAQALSDEQRHRTTAETDARAQAEAYATAVAERDELRERLTRAETRAPRRSRRTPEPAQEPSTFDGAPVPEVPGVGVSTVLAVLQARKTYPDETQKQLAERVQVSDRTVRSVLAAVPDRDLAVAAT
jgi:chromosome segregation ATPase